MNYVALLRGVNVGGNTKVPMTDLKKTFELLGFTDVRTVLNSGNVVFTAKEDEISLVAQQIEEKLEKTFGFSIRVMVRIKDEVKSLVDSDPFRKVIITPETRLYVTFFSKEPKMNLQIPYESPEKNFSILQVSNHEICSVLILSSKRGTVDLMSFIGKNYGKNITTRNWNTVRKLSDL